VSTTIFIIILDDAKQNKTRNFSIMEEVL